MEQGYGDIDAFRAGMHEAARILEAEGLSQAANVLRVRMLVRDAIPTPRREWTRGAPAILARAQGPMVATRAMAAMLRFPNQKAFVDASEEELMKLPRIGRKTVDALLSIQAALRPTTP